MKFNNYLIKKKVSSINRNHTIQNKIPKTQIELKFF